MPQETIQHALGEIHSAADAGTAASAIDRALRSVCGELDPLLGSQAVRALYARSLHVTRLSFGDLGQPAAEPLDDLLTALQRDIAARQPADARRLGETLLTALADLLTSLIGEPLTHRLLRSAWSNFAPGALSQEKRND